MELKSLIAPLFPVVVVTAAKPAAGGASSETKAGSGGKGGAEADGGKLAEVDGSGSGTLSGLQV